MKKHKIYLYTLYDKPFASIASGRKDIEMRLYDEKRKEIQIGDYIEFSKLDGSKKILTKVLALHIFDTFDDLYRAFNKERLGYLSDEDASPSDMEQYYSIDKILKNKVVGIEIKIVNNKMQLKVAELKTKIGR